MSTPNNPHDLFFKRTWSQLDLAQRFFARYLPAAVCAELKLDTLALVKDSFIDESLAAHYSDLLYQVQTHTGQTAHLYILLEHKSYLSEWTGLQLLGYMLRIWERVRQQQPHPPLPAIIPLLLYHGDRHWTAATDFSALINAPQSLQRYIPQFHYQLCDLNQDQLDHLHDQATLAIALRVLKYSRSRELPQQLRSILALFTALLKQDNDLGYLGTVLRYLAQVSEPLNETILQAALLEALPPNIGERLMPTLAETWLEQGVQKGLLQGIEKGIEQGIEKGIEKGSEAHARATLRRLLTQRFGALPAAIERRIEQAPQNRLDGWLDQVISAPSLAAIFDNR